MFSFPATTRTLTLAIATMSLLSAVPSAASAADLEGASLGGIIRSGPGTNFERLDSLKEGSLLTLQEETNIKMDGYSWFKVSHIDNQTGYSVSGYQWGGILCAFDANVAGVFKQCPRSWSDNIEVTGDQ